MRRIQKEIEDIALDLIPIMNLFTALIPFLLMSAVFFRSSVIEVSSSSESISQVQEKQIDDKIYFKINILKDRFETDLYGDVITPQEKKEFQNIIPHNTNSLPIFKEITRIAKHVKEKYMNIDTVIISPSNDIPYEDVIKTIDSLRNTEIETQGHKNQMSLFPRVVLSNKTP